MNIFDEIKRLEAEADRLYQSNGDDDAWEALWQAVNDLDRRAGPGLAILLGANSSFRRRMPLPRT